MIILRYKVMTVMPDLMMTVYCKGVTVNFTIDGKFYDWGPVNNVSEYDINCYDYAGCTGCPSVKQHSSIQHQRPDKHVYLDPNEREIWLTVIDNVLG